MTHSARRRRFLRFSPVRTVRSYQARLWSLKNERTRLERSLASLKANAVTYPAVRKQVFEVTSEIKVLGDEIAQIEKELSYTRRISQIPVDKTPEQGPWPIISWTRVIEP